MGSSLFEIGMLTGHDSRRRDAGRYGRSAPGGLTGGDAFERSSQASN
jgi:hypothetical protein